MTTFTFDIEGPQRIGWRFNYLRQRCSICHSFTLFHMFDTELVCRHCSELPLVTTNADTGREVRAADRQFHGENYRE